MTRIKGVEPGEASFLTRVAYWMTKRDMGKLPEAVKIAAHSKRLFRGMAFMEMAQQKFDAAPKDLVALVEIKVATMIGCPF